MGYFDSHLTVAGIETGHDYPVAILYGNENEAAVTFTRDEIDWLVLEDASYEPMPYAEAETLFPALQNPDRSGNYPFVTSGERRVVDATK